MGNIIIFFLFINPCILEEIKLKNNFWHEGYLKLIKHDVLIKAAEAIKIHKAKHLLLNGKNILIIDDEFVSDLEMEIYSNFKGLLALDNIKTITEKQAKILSNKTGPLSLGKITEISDATAKNLANIKGDLFLRDLKSITNKSAQMLAGHGGNNIYLLGLENISKDQASSLMKYNGKVWLYYKIIMPKKSRIEMEESGKINFHLSRFKWLIKISVNGL